MKQIDFDFRVYPIGNTEGNYNHEMLRQEIRTQYLDSGWEVFKTEISQVSAGVIYLAVTFVKYEKPELAEEILNTPVSSVDKRGPGRPKKEEVVPA